MDGRERGRARSAGLTDVDAAANAIDQLSAAGITIPKLFETLARSADPDQALKILTEMPPHLATEMSPENLCRYLLVAGASAPLARLVGQDAWLLERIDSLQHMQPGSISPNLNESPAWLENWYEGAAASFSEARCGQVQAQTALRRAYYRELLGVVSADLEAKSAPEILDLIALMLSILADLAFQTALELAQETEPSPCAVAIIALGKCGARELNYCSDVDVVYLAEDGASEEELAKATQIIMEVQNLLSAPGPFPAPWPVDAALRPEGARGPLLRTLGAHLSYYQTWAHSWEFQALLKARYLAGDRDLAEGYLKGVEPLVWQASSREGFVDDARAMRQRVERHAFEANDTDIKLGPGGLRDVEFTVQLLQLVHGRVDENLRPANTLGAIAALGHGGYIGRPATEALSNAYRFARALEHRAQLQRLRRTRKLPRASAQLRALARSMAGENLTGAQELTDKWKENAELVRSLHRSLFYRPLLPQVAQLTDDNLRLTDTAAAERLSMLGYRDPKRASEHLRALVRGLSRAAAIQRQILPIMLAWFADGVDPDAGLARYRSLSEDLAESHWYLGFLRDSGSACQNLARVLSTSRYIAEGLRSWPQAVRWLDSNQAQFLPPLEQIQAEASALQARYSDPAEFAASLRSVRSREFLRAAIAVCLQLVDARALGEYLSGINEITVMKLLRAINPDEGAYTVIAMGSFGAKESSFASDLDAIVIAGNHVDPALAHAQLSLLQELLAQGLPGQSLRLDFALRPEGGRGAITRTLAGYESYYGSWSEQWEHQALLRARALSDGEASRQMAAAFSALVDPLRYPSEFGEKDLANLRRMKARIERERIPRAISPTQHLKLGPGGTTDIEWVAQLLQLRYGHAHPQLHHTNTAKVLQAGSELGLIAADDAAELIETDALIRLARAGIVLASGRTSGSQLDKIPQDREQLRALAAIIGSGVADADRVNQRLRAAMRRARLIVERVFYGVANSAQ